MIRGVVFDLDHTLFDRYGTLQKVLPTFYHHYRSRIPEELSVEAFIDRFVLLEKKYIYYGWRRQLQGCVDDGILFPIADEDFKKNHTFYSSFLLDNGRCSLPFYKPYIAKAAGYGLQDWSNHQRQSRCAI